MNVPPDTAAARSPRRRWALVAAPVVLVVVLVTLGVTTHGSDDHTSSAAAATTSAAPASVVLAPAADTPQPTGPTDDAADAPTSLAAVGLDEPADTGAGVTAQIVSLEAITAAAQGPGSVNGPALELRLRLTNGTSGPLSLGGVSVEMAFGQDLTPASPNDDPSAAPLSGTVAAGQSAEGVYVFTLPVDERSDVTVTVAHQAGAPFLVFHGSVG